MQSRTPTRTAKALADTSSRRGAPSSTQGHLATSNTSNTSNTITIHPAHTSSTSVFNTISATCMIVLPQVLLQEW
jgi:hypothetical protein